LLTHGPKIGPKPPRPLIAAGQADDRDRWGSGRRELDITTAPF
jgi:hypothetical protein